MKTKEECREPIFFFFFKFFRKCAILEKFFDNIDMGVLYVLDAAGVVALVILLLYIALEDASYYTIPDSMLEKLLLIGLWGSLLFPVSAAERVAGFCIMGAFLLCIDLISPGSFGGGDIKLSAIAGGLLGLKWAMFALCAGFLSSGIYCSVMLVFKKKSRKDKIAFGPFICFWFIFCILLIKCS